MSAASADVVVEQCSLSINASLPFPQESCLCAGAGNEADGTSCRGYKPDRPSILVVGNEGRGLRAVIRRACQDILRIDSMVAAEDQFAPVGAESLNVSVATGILLHQLLQPTTMVA